MKTLQQQRRLARMRNQRTVIVPIYSPEGRRLLIETVILLCTVMLVGIGLAFIVQHMVASMVPLAGLLGSGGQ